MTPAECIKNLRLQLGRNQAEFAFMIHKDKATISLYESGKRKPSFSTVREIVSLAKSHGIDINFIDIRNE